MQNVIGFDYYGTLVKLNSPFEKIKHMLQKYIEDNFPEISFNQFYISYQKNMAVLSTGKQIYQGINLLTESLDRTCNRYKIPSLNNIFVPFAEELFIFTEAYPDAGKVINFLKNNFIVGVLSNADNYLIDISIARHNFNFDFVITSEDAGYSKPDNRFFEYALKRIGRRTHELYMIGDSQNDDILGAGRLGIKTIWINRNGELLKEGMNTPCFEVKELKEIPFLLT